MAGEAALLSPLAVGLAGIGPAIGIGMLTSAFFQSVARQPESQASLTMFYFISLGVIELLGLLGFVAFILAQG